MIIVTGRMFQSVRPYAQAAGIDDPVVCYQGAVVADPVSGRFLRHEPIPLELAKEAIAAVQAEGYPLNCYVDDELYVAENTAASEAYASFQNLEVHAVGDLLEWLDAPPTKLVAVGDPVELDGLKERMVERFDGRMYISKSLAVLPRVREPGGDEGRRARLPRRAPRLRRGRRRSRSGTARTTSSCSSGPDYGVAVENAHERVLAVADLVCPAGHRGGRRPGDRGLPRLRRVIDLRAARNDPDGLPRRAGAEGRCRRPSTRCSPPTSTGARSCPAPTSCAAG